MLFFVLAFNFCLSLVCIFATIALWKIFLYLRGLNEMLDEMSPALEKSLRDSGDFFISKIDEMERAKSLYTNIPNLPSIIRTFILLIFSEFSIYPNKKPIHLKILLRLTNSFFPGFDAKFR